MAENENTPKLPAQSGQELGASGTFIYSGFISGEEYNQDLQGKYGLQIYDTMRRSDSTVHASLIVCKNPIIGAVWDIEPASSDEKDVEIADFVNRELFNRKIMWTDTLREALTSLDFGHSVFEIVNDITDFNGKPHIGLAKLAPRKQRSILKWETNAKEPGITQYTPEKGMVSIPRNKLLYVVNEKEGDNYEGISLLRYAYKPWKIKDALEIINAIALERMAIGIPVIKKGEANSTSNTPVPENELKSLRTAMRQMRANEESYLETPVGTTVEMLDMKSQSTKDVLPTIEYQNTQITLSVLAQFLMLGSNGSSGSRAVSSDHSSLFVKSLEAIARSIQQAFQLDVINRLVDLNYTNLQNGYPKLRVTEISDDDVTAFSTAVSNLANSGALTPDANVENRIRQVLELPTLTDEAYDNYEEMKKARQQPAGPLPTPTDDGGDGATPKDNKTEIDDAADKVPEDDKTTATIIKDAKEIQKRLIAHIFED